MVARGTDASVTWTEHLPHFLDNITGLCGTKPLTKSEHNFVGFFNCIFVQLHHCHLVDEINKVLKLM